MLDGFALVMIVFIVFASILAALVIVSWTIVRLAGGGSRGFGRHADDKTIQEIYHGLVKMEERIDALETLLLDRDRKEAAR